MALPLVFQPIVTGVGVMLWSTGTTVGTVVNSKPPIILKVALSMAVSPSWSESVSFNLTLLETLFGMPSTVQSQFQEPLAASATVANKV